MRSRIGKERIKDACSRATPKPGGYCTSFNRKGFTFDSAVHYVQGAGGNGWLCQILRDLGVEAELEFIRLDPIYRLIYPNKSISIPADLNEYIAWLSLEFPNEKKGIVRLFDTIVKSMAELPRLPTSLGIWDLVSFPFRFPLTYKSSKITFAEMMADFITDQRLKSIISSGWLCVGLPPSKVSAFQMSGYIYSAHVLGCYYPKGGAQAFAEALATALRRHGGVLQLKTDVTKILVEKNRVTGVQTSDGREIGAKCVVSNADAKETFLNLVGREKLSRRFAERLDKMEPSMTCFLVWLGTDLDPRSKGINESEIVYYSSYDNDEIYGKLFDGGFEEAYLVGIPSFIDPDLAPQGRHIVSILYPVSYDFEKKWRTDNGKRGEEYRTLKEELKDQLVKTVERIIPGLSEHIVTSEAATPLTLERYTRNYKGAAYGWAHGPSQTGRNRLQPTTPIKGLYLAGHWTVPGTSTAVAAVSGRRTAEIIMKGQR